MTAALTCSRRVMPHLSGRGQLILQAEIGVDQPDDGGRIDLLVLVLAYATPAFAQ